jgi:hypothetical protein
MLPQHQAHGLLLRPHSLHTLRYLSLSWPRRGLSDDFSASSSWPSTRSLLECFLHSPLSCLHSSHVPCMHIPPILFLLSEGNSSQPVLLDPMALRADILQLDHASIHGGG